MELVFDIFDIHLHRTILSPFQVQNSSEPQEFLGCLPRRIRWYRRQIQYCAKVMQTNFDEILCFSGLFEGISLKTIFNKISSHFRDTYCFDPREFSSDNLLLPKVTAIIRTIIHSS